MPESDKVLVREATRRRSASWEQRLPWGLMRKVLPRRCMIGG